MQGDHFQQKDAKISCVFEKMLEISAQLIKKAYVIVNNCYEINHDISF